MIENNEIKRDKFYIELSIGDLEEDLKNIGKDNLTKKEVLKIFIEYFENNNLLDMKDWYEVEI